MDCDLFVFFKSGKYIFSYISFAQNMCVLSYDKIITTRFIFSFEPNLLKIHSLTIIELAIYTCFGPGFIIQKHHA